MTDLDCPLKRLRLNAEEWAALRQQGSVSGERRCPDCTVYKLRFRISGKQKVRYLGTSAAEAEAVRTALARWQGRRRRELQARALVRLVRRTLRECKARLEPQVKAAGLRFHGRAIRRPRSGPACNVMGQ